MKHGRMFLVLVSSLAACGFSGIAQAQQLSAPSFADVVEVCT